MPDAPADDAGDNVDVACGALARASCTLRDTCTSGGNISRAYGDMAACLERETLACTLGATAPDTGSTTDTIEACVAAYATLACRDFFDNNLPAACEPLGRRKQNASCTFASQCESGYCNNNKAATCGTCANPPAVGASCLDANCGHGQVCDARTDTCVSDELAGAACDNNTQPCGFALACVGNSTGVGTCTAETSGLGDACNGTAAGLCDAKANLSCTGDSGARTCQAATFAGDGEACGAQPTGNISCAAGGACYDAAGMLARAGEPGTCKAAAADGAACDVDHGPACLAPARCVVAGGGSAGTCTLPMPSC